MAKVFKECYAAIRENYLNKKEISKLLIIFFLICPIVSAQAQYSTAAIDLSSAGITRIVTGTANRSIYVTSFGVLTYQGAAATSTTIQFVYGNGSNCGGTNAPALGGFTAITGSLSATSGTMLSAVGGTPVFTIPATSNTSISMDLCAVLPNAGSARGWVTYYIQ